MAELSTSSVVSAGTRGFVAVVRCSVVTISTTPSVVGDIWASVVGGIGVVVVVAAAVVGGGGIVVVSTLD